MSDVRLDEPPLTPIAPLPALPPAASSSFPARRLRHLLCLLPLLLIGGWAVVNWRVMRDGATRLASADPGWLLAACLLTCLSWAAAACIRQGCIPERLPPGLLYASQVAAGAANDVLPAGIGGHAVTLRFLRRRGISLDRASASLALYSLVKPVAGAALILLLLLSGSRLPLDGPLALLAVGGLVSVLLLAALLLAAVHPVRGRVVRFLRTALTDARLLHARPSRILALWGGAAAFPLVQASALACVGASLGLPLSWQQVVLAYLAAQAAAGAIPTPGGIGSVDAALVLAFTAQGIPLALATSTVLSYRVLTVWLPLLPGGLLLTALVRARVL